MWPEFFMKDSDFPARGLKYVMGKTGQGIASGNNGTLTTVLRGMSGL
jgi:hypothetical protein